MKNTAFYTIAILAIGGLIYLNFFRSKKPETNVLVIKTDSAPQPIGPYSQAIRKGNALFVSGQVGIEPNGKFDTASIEDETRQAMNNIKAILNSAGLTMNDIAKTTIYLTDVGNFKRVNEVYAAFFTNGIYPARETVGVAALPKGMHIEISVTAAK
ncbi:MAG TPA: Rid family detoxifying hydrolase [Bacteroidia bacterium]|jgi:2-iminobutanoate/2-iminopropanoate deaminase|nr:Rid family detoxifying hydrolase [Bacteroidia bacterium]